MHLFGIVQGRLIDTDKKNLQSFPKKWQDEFAIAQKLNFNFIEFFTERKFNKNNPIWDDDKIKLYKKLCKKNNLKIINFCDDFVISNSLFEQKTIQYLKKLNLQLVKLGIKNLILPLYGKNNLTDKNYKNFFIVFKKIFRIFTKVNIVIESNISPKSFVQINNHIKPFKLKFLFDTGNRVNLKRDMYEDISKFNKDLFHIHLKDKDLKRKNVKLGKGLVNFKKLFNTLNLINYNKNYTFENTRGSNAYKSAKSNFKFIKRYINFKK